MLSDTPLFWKTKMEMLCFFCQHCVFRWPSPALPVLSHTMQHVFSLVLIHCMSQKSSCSICLRRGIAVQHTLDGLCVVLFVLFLMTFLFVSFSHINFCSFLSLVTEESVELLTVLSNVCTFGCRRFFFDTSIAFFVPVFC